MKTKKAEQIEFELGATILKLHNLSNDIDAKEKEISLLKALSIPLEAKVRKLDHELHQEILINFEGKGEETTK
jgi:hypothetical protein